MMNSGLEIAECVGYTGAGTVFRPPWVGSFYTALLYRAIIKSA